MIGNLLNVMGSPNTIHYFKDPRVLISQNDQIRAMLGPYGVEISYGLLFLAWVAGWKLVEIGIFKGWW
jgi:hypothetical protein